MGSNGNGKLPPTQQRMLDLLSDGKPHKKLELKGLLWDEHANVNTIQYHISYLRKYVRGRGQEVICELYGFSVRYRLVELIGAARVEANTCAEPTSKAMS